MNSVVGGRFDDDEGSGFRNNTADFGAGGSSQQRGGTGANGQQMPHSMRGFKRALMRTQRSSGRLKDQLPSKEDTGGPGYRKPNYFAQGGQRHGLHVGAGAPFTGPATGDAAEGFGGD